MSSLSYATTGSGPSAGGIGWINFGSGFSVTAGSTVTGLSLTLLDGSTMTFDISNTGVVNGGRTVAATVPNPAYAFGSLGYTGITGNVSILTQSAGGQYGTRITISNISLTDTNGNAINNYSLILADSQNTLNSNEGQEWKTFGGGSWQQLTFLGGPASPNVTGVSTNTVTITGTGSTGGTPILTTTSPTSIEVYLYGASGNEGVAFGVAINKVQINKVITSRYSPTDQFDLTISGTPTNTSTTTGSSTGLQPISSNVFGLVGNTYSINESMSSGILTNYITTVSWSNLAAGGTTIPSPAALGNTVTLALGDVFVATITNKAKPIPTLSYATSGTGPSAGGIGWINFGSSFSLSPGETITDLSVSLLDGSTMTFDISNTAITNGGFAYNGVTSPTFGGAAFGVDGYTGIVGQICLSSSAYTGPASATSRFTLSNITVTDSLGNPVPNYTIIVADSESTDGLAEQQQFITNGAVWNLFYEIDSSRNGPSIGGSGTQTVTLSGIGDGNASGPIFTSNNPTNVSAAITTSGSGQAFSFGIAVSKITIAKNITSRYSAMDQFDLIISGSPSNTETTSGSSTGLQPITANIYGVYNNTYSINETMATGSLGTLANYTTTVAWSNAVSDGTVGALPGALGNNITLALGDLLTATIINTVKSTPPGRGVEFI